VIAALIAGGVLIAAALAGLAVYGLACAAAGREFDAWERQPGGEVTTGYAHRRVNPQVRTGRAGYAPGRPQNGR
jgi:hypothetical protein